ncbi:carboxyltransferase domain-containing protein [Devosia sp.]|uniref:5-oxoprolinase subunit B family protein n=1 Tax=Devosia sp. TaxID=1871048 RepID=UPI003263F200
MADASLSSMETQPWIVPLGDRAVLVRFANSLSDGANQAAIGFARRFGVDAPAGVQEVVPSLVSVLVTYDPSKIEWSRLTGELRLALSGRSDDAVAAPVLQKVKVRFGGEDGPDLDAVAETLGMDADRFVELHNLSSLRVLAVGFAPGFVYCGFHPNALIVPRRSAVRPSVPAGSILFAAGQTAIAATAIPTGWHVIGRTALRNFDPQAVPPTRLSAGDPVQFERLA